MSGGWSASISIPAKGSAPPSFPRTTRTGKATRYSREELAELDNPVAALFCIEKSQDSGEVGASVQRLRRADPPLEPSLKQAFETWLRKVIQPRWASSGEAEENTDPWTLEEDDTMLAERMDRWYRQAEEKGLQEGLQKGLQKGEARMLLRLLGLKFGPLAPEVEERVLSADKERLEEWSERVLTAERLQDVFVD